MQRERIERRSIFRKDGVPSHLPRFWNQIQGRSRQRRHVQRLANMAGGLRPTAVLVDESSASSKIQERNAAQHGQRALCNSMPKNDAWRTHILMALW